ncbi:GDSL-type esterase/lipase family protein [Salinispirillum sp. LH 10-3-1]|uniref:GDSL-type esterase/lipase family protein n=1 Tax=Salinispirillum sp. LH 10-3-1 TaxID=2952525 RepID=A0AB38YFM9_9GAMM
MTERYLFLGDSVTDCDRQRSVKQPNRSEALGYGWVNRVATELLAMSPSAQVWNRGFGGCRVNELLTHDWCPLKQTRGSDFTCITLLLGINDIWYPMSDHEAPDVARILANFNALLETLKPLMERMVVMEPFAIPGTATDDQWWPPLQAMQFGMAELVAQHGLIWLPLQAEFSAHSAGQSALWAYDGVHPEVLGHRWLADQWLTKVACTG